MNEPALGERRLINASWREAFVMSHASIRERVIWTIISLVVLSFTFGILLCNAIQRSMLQQDFLLMWLWLLEVPLFFIAIVINTKRILNAIPQGQST
jgi:hypothetical protein